MNGGRSAPPISDRVKHHLLGLQSPVCNYFIAPEQNNIHVTVTLTKAEEEKVIEK